MAKNIRSPMNFDSMLQTDVPCSRNGKHHEIVARIFSDLMQLKHGRAIKVPLDALSESKENIRSALNREGRKRGLHVATASDGSYLYVWRNGKDEENA